MLFFVEGILITFQTARMLLCDLLVLLLKTDFIP